MKLIRSKLLSGFTVLAILCALWGLYYIYLWLPSYVLAPVQFLKKDAHSWVGAILKLDYGRFPGRLIRLFFVISVYIALIFWTPLRRRLWELLKIPRQKKILLCACIVPCFFVLLEFLVAWHQNWISNVQIQSLSLFPLLFYGSIMLCTAIAEEMAFRGITIATLENVVGVYSAVAIQALYFGFIHWYYSGEIIYGITTIVAGLLLGCMVVQTRSLWPAIIFHWLWNSFQTLLYSKSIVSFTIANHYWLGSRTTPDEEGLFSGISTCIIFVLWLLYHRLNQQRSWPTKNHLTMHK